jgi:hypothetical protein
MSNPTTESLFLFSVLGVLRELTPYHEQQELILTHGSFQVVEAINFLQAHNEQHPGVPVVPAAAEYLRQFQSAAHLFLVQEFKNVN